MRICSFLPSATEILYALGLEESIVGVTFECDFPPAARSKPIVVNTRLPHAAEQAEIDRIVREYVSRGESLYRVEGDVLRNAAPDLVVTQELCRVCAATPGDFSSVLDSLSPPPRVLSLHPHGLDEILEDIRAVGRAAGRDREAGELVLELGRRLDRVRTAVSGAPRPRVLCLEWTSPPYVAGHWIPEMVELAGGTDVFGRADKPSFRVDWEEIEESRPDLVVAMPCGYGLEKTLSDCREARLPAGRPIHAVDANSYFSRPGPRLVTGVEVLAHLLHPDRVASPVEGAFRSL
jgi:iron complex transport system substrate-binding protein